MLSSCRAEFDTETEWKPPKLPKRLSNASQGDPDLISHICEEWLLPPSRKPRRLKRPEILHYSASNQSLIVDNILRHSTLGFYIECAAADGETISNSLEWPARGRQIVLV